MSKPVTKKKPGAKSTVSKKAAAKQTAPKKAAKTAAKQTTLKKTAAKQTTLKKTAAKQTAAKKATKTAAKQTAPKKTAAKQTAAKKTAAKQTAAKQTAAKKTAAKQTATKKTAPRSAKRTVSPAQSGAVDFTSAYKLPQLLRRVGPATVDEVRAQVAVPDAQLIAQGAQVATGRISIDSARMYGQALDILTQATPKVKKALLGVTPTLLRIAIFSAQHGAELYAERNQSRTTQKTQQTARRDSMAVAIERGLAQREQLRAVYLAVTGDEPTWRGRIVTAYGTAKDPADLAKALGRLVDIGEELVNSTDSDLRARQKDSGLVQELLTQVRSLAEEIALQGPAGQAAQELSAVSQAEVDLWDGLNLVLLERVMNLVNAAHEVEPSIPRLVPMSLRTYFSPSSGKKVAPTSEAPTPSSA